MRYDEIALIFSNGDLYECARDLADSGYFPRQLPQEIYVSDHELEPTTDWLHLIDKREDLSVNADDGDFFITDNSVDARCSVRFYDAEFDFSKLNNDLRNVRFELMSTMTLYETDWRDPERGLRNDEYVRPSFADGHVQHGWGCAFKGKGHDRLVSRRWLDYGPWRVIRHEDVDLTFILFHDVEETDKATTFAQAKPGHRRMGISDDGGFMQTDFCWTHKWNGTYLQDVRQYQVFKTAAVGPFEMLEARATVHYQRLGPERPLDSFAFVFMTEELAREHLHELWLREVQCWAIIEGALTRLDDTYDPGPPVKPQWVIDVEAREASRGD